jgi:hypothetical protein
MKRTTGRNVEIDYDSTGGFVQLDWECPYCHEQNRDFLFVAEYDVIKKGSFEIDVKCDFCNKQVIAECYGARRMKR